MLSVILCTHSNFANGIKDALEMICGPQEGLYSLGFYEGDDFQEYVSKIKTIADAEIGKSNEVVCLVDIPHATPFNSCIVALSELDISVVPCLSLPLLLEIVTQRSSTEKYDDVINGAIEASKACVYNVSIKEFLLQGV